MLIENQNILKSYLNILSARQRSHQSASTHRAFMSRLVHDLLFTFFFSDLEDATHEVVSYNIIN